MRRRRSRRRGRSGSLLAVALLVGWLVVASGAGLTSTAFSTAAVSRGTSVDVTIDSAGAHSLDTAGAVHVNATDPLVNVTNHLARGVTITVSLRSGSTDVGDLVVGSTRADSVTFSLPDGDRQTVELAVPNDGTLVGRTAYFDVNATAPGLTATATNRSAPVES